MGVNAPSIVIVDDDDAIREIVTAVAQEAVPAASITAYFSSLQALQQIDTGDPDLLITNCHMPDMDGPTLVKTLREKKNAIPIIMVSGSPEARELGEQAGIDRFVAKETLHTALGEAIHALLPRF